MPIVLGCLADDLTGATDLAMILKRSGMKTVQIVGTPNSETPVPDAEAVVVALKSRTIPPNEAIEMSLAASIWLQAAGAEQIFFKYCSTFDSTSDGNIGPVTDALMAQLQVPYTIACPSFPENKRTVYRGYLFVNDGLLSESSLRNHPLTPMHDSNLSRVLSTQSKTNVANIFMEDVEQGSAAVRDILQNTPTDQPTIYITDAISDVHLLAIGDACRGMKLITGGSAVAQGLAANFRKDGLLPAKTGADVFTAPDGASAILSGSCSEMTLIQIEHAKLHLPHFPIKAADILSGKDVLSDALAWAKEAIQTNQSILLYSSTDPETIASIQNTNDRIAIGLLVEEVMAAIARGLNDMGVRRLVVAGGETSGAVINALGIKTMQIGPEIDPGVPWTKSLDGGSFALALKSGNFGGEDFFIKAIKQLHDLASEHQRAGI